MNDLDFKRGVWHACVYLVVTIDQPSYAKELIKSAKISYDEAFKFEKETGLGRRDVLIILQDEKTW